MLDQPRAQAAARSVEEYGKTLYSQVFRDAALIAAYGAYNPDEVRIEIIGPPEFHSLHWEAMWNPKSPKPLAVRAAIVRRVAAGGGSGIRIADSPSCEFWWWFPGRAGGQTWDTERSRARLWN